MKSCKSEHYVLYFSYVDLLSKTCNTEFKNSSDSIEHFLKLFSSANILLVSSNFISAVNLQHSRIPWMIPLPHN